MTQQVAGLPGVRSDRTATPRIVVISSGVYLPAGKIIDASNARDPLNTGDLDVLRAGLVMGKITASGLYAPSILGVLASAYTGVGTTVTSMTVSAATAVEIVRRLGAAATFKLTGPPSAAGTVATTTVTYSAVNVTTGVITVTDPNVNAIAGSYIQPTDGSESPLCLIGDGYGIKVTDIDSADVDCPFPNALIGGIIDASQIVNYPSDTSLLTWLKTTNLNAQCQFTYDDDF